MKKRARPSAASQGVDQAWAAVTTMIGGFAVWGGVGWLLDRWWGTKFALPVGVILGMALGVYAVVVRYGIAPTQVGTKSGAAAAPVDARSDTAPKRPQGQGDGVGAASGAIGARSGSGEPGPTPSDSSTPTRAVPGSVPTGSER
jgi:F0F1-type ATP synthase assembly protein I